MKTRPLQIDKNSVALYVKVVENGSFSKTAAREGVPVPTLSRRISDLEKALGVRLLERSTRQLRVTEIGLAFFEICRRGMTEFEAAESLVAHRQAVMSGRLRISVPPSMSDTVVVPLVNAFHALYPKVVVHCLVTERFIDHIGDGIDLSLRVGDLSDSSLVARTVTLNRSRLVASPGYLALSAGVSHPLELLPHVWLAFSRWERPLQWSLSSGGETVKVQPEPRLVLNDYAGVLRGVIDGTGISELPGFICEPALREGSLVEVLPQWRFPSVKVAATYPSNRHLSPLVRVFIEFCADYFDCQPLAAKD